MKFTKATILSTLATAAANVNAQGHGPTKAGKNKNGAGSDDYDYEFPTSADFAGLYEACFQTTILTNRFGQNATYNLCRDDDFTQPPGSGNPFEGGIFTGPKNNITIIPTDAFNAYQAKIGIELTGSNRVVVSVRNFQGFANGDNLEMQTFGVDDGLFINHTPDVMSCTLHKSGVLSCTQMTQEYCGVDDPFEGCNGVEGEWFMTQSIYTVSAKDISDCPEPPHDFCPDYPAPLCNVPARRLVELSERNAKSPEAEEEDGHRRLVTDHDEGVITQVHSKDFDRLEWIKEHIAERMEHIEAGGTSGWDPLIEEYFKNVHSKDIEIDCSFAEGSFKCNSSSETQCGQDLIKGHADLHGEFAVAIQKKEGNPEFVPRDVPDSCV